MKERIKFLRTISTVSNMYGLRDNFGFVQDNNDIEGIYK
jgi:hypothetical protein